MTARKRELPNAERRLLDYAHLAVYLSVSLATAKELGGPNGQIPRVKIGERVLFDRADVDAYIERIKRAS